MNDDRRKALSVYLNETWHEPLSPKECSCGMKVVSDRYHLKCRGVNRTFTTPDDFFALKDKLDKKGEFEKFWEWSESHDDSPNTFEGHANWLINPTRFCELVGEWIEREDR